MNHDILNVLQTALKGQEFYTHLPETTLAFSDPELKSKFFFQKDD